MKEGRKREREAEVQINWEKYRHAYRQSDREGRIAYTPEHRDSEETLCYKLMNLIDYLT